ncbi:hypothetical protein N7491_004813 [Penicillium cf. griseofulvum]|uniref:Ketoreductase (KR) domain-containing protein n=1 Tax=Penicillium cf. griseofulvum TaxID=2972120 RepID=A0A9W9J546_9EURO|nr:hypothetical protein N7472_007504 [Penicillium cf. griseofulvum]KAJ5434218.1 hypothetical protein N7491_004813 [Penicillium cf. griseofulvum]KAJ5452045.1 hypothetical protein N7445_000228 [Penicillium cf. griseofulvum]
MIPGLSSASKVVVSGGIGRATASSFTISGPRALILLGRRADALAETATIVRARYADVPIQTYEADLYNTPSVCNTINKVAAKFSGIDTLIHYASVLAPIIPLLEADLATFLDSYKTTVIGSLSFVVENPQDIDELKARKEEIVGDPLGTGEL